MRKWKTRALSLFLAALLLALTVLPALAATASTIRLAKTEGTVSVTNTTKRALSTRDNMLLYSGCQVQTRTDSYAWINLDDSKLGKLDASSSAEVRKSGKKQELLLKSGNLYFNVTSPLASDETLNIRTSTMMVGIRGTCGWVKELDEYTTELYLLEGTVQVSSPDPATGGTKTATVNAGEKVTATVRPQGSEITQEKFEVKDIDGFVMEELSQDSDLFTNILEAFGLDVLGTFDGFISYNGHVYALSNTKTVWSQAKEICEKLGGHLATITTEEEQKAIEELVRAYRKKESYWLGAQKVGDDWKWITNEVFSYSNWAPGQPDWNPKLPPDPVVMQIFAQWLTWDDTWNDGDHGGGITDQGFICEWDQ